MRIVLSLTLVASTLACPGLALADCPVAADMADGVRLTFANGTVQDYHAGDDGIVVMDAMDTGGNSFRLELAHGFHVLRFVGTSGGKPVPGSDITYDYGVPIAELPLPAPGARWELAATVRDSNGTRTERLLEAWDDLQRLTIGDCTYDAIDVAVAYGADNSYIDRARYLPELSLLFVLDDATTGEPMTPTGIEVLPD